MRKVIQLATMPAALVERARYEAGLYALCADGTMWVMWAGELEWTRVGNVPQEAPNAD